MSTATLSRVSSLARLTLLALATVSLAACGGGGGGSSSGSGSLSAIPSGVVLYTTEDSLGRSTLYYLTPSTGASTAVRTYAANVTIFGASPNGKRLVVSKPLSDGLGNSGLYVTDLNGTGHTVRMGNLATARVNDASITAAGDVIDATADGVNIFSVSGINYNNGLGIVGAGSPSYASNGAGTEGVYVVRDAINRDALPGRTSDTTLIETGTYSWVRFSADGTRIVFTNGADIYTMARDGSSVGLVASGGSYPTFGASSDRIYFSRVGDGIYVKDTSTGTVTRVAAISGTWSGRIVWH